MNKDTVETAIMPTIIDLMHCAERSPSLNDGIMKKKYVLDGIKLVLGLEVYKRYAPLIDLVIDALVSISRKDIKLCLVETKKFCLPLFKSCRNKDDIM